MVNANIFGCHSSFYYFGIEHLLVNMYTYINNGINRKELICLCMKDTVYDKVLETLGTKYKHIQLCEMDKIINIHKCLGLERARNNLLEYEKKAKDEGYTGIRFIIQPDHLIFKTSEKDFLSFEKDINHIVLGVNASFMCIYDFEDYITNKLFINNNVIEESYKTHTHRLYNNELSKGENFFKL